MDDWKAALKKIGVRPREPGRWIAGNAPPGNLSAWGRNFTPVLKAFGVTQHEVAVSILTDHGADAYYALRTWIRQAYPANAEVDVETAIRACDQVANWRFRDRQITWSPDGVAEGQSKVTAIVDRDLVRQLRMVAAARESTVAALLEEGILLVLEDANGGFEDEEPKEAKR